MDEAGAFLDDEALNDYNRHRLQFERTVLHKLFLEEAYRRLPDWKKIYDSPLTRLRKDYSIAVNCCSDTAKQPAIERWLDTVEVGWQNIRQQTPVGTPDISPLGFAIRSLEDRIYDDLNTSDTVKPAIVGPE